MNEILELQELPSAEGTEQVMPLVSTVSAVPPCPGWPSAFTTGNC